MIVKILWKSTSFKGISYNTGKMERDKGELMKVSGFGALQAFEDLRPSDYVNYLEAVSSRSTRIKYPQFHAIISCKGKSHSKGELTEIASAWMKGMGYGNQPYILVFHKDTANNHIHAVSTRIDRSGKKISDSFEKLRAYQVLDQVLGRDSKEQLGKDFAKALAYRFSTRAQFMMILEAKGYKLELNGNTYRLYKFGQQLGTVNLEQVDQRIASYEKDKKRIRQLRAVFERYRLRHNGEVYVTSRPLPGGDAGPGYGYSSRLAEVLQQKFGLQILYHGKPGKPPYGFSILDHAGTAVLKGKEVIDIALFIANGVPATENLPAPEVTEQHQAVQGLKDDQLANSAAREAERSAMFQKTDSNESPHQEFLEPGPEGTAMDHLQIDIADDIDDEQILGRNRRRKRKARTNSR